MDQRLARLDRVLWLTVPACAVLAILAHAALLPLGRWYPDEFIQFANHRALGWQAVADRILHWSPRPFSELLLFLYSTAVFWAEIPGVAVVLAVGWTGVLVLLLAASRIAGIGLALPICLVAASLLVTQPGEVWYWPAAALAYLPAFAGLGAAVLLIASPIRRPMRDPMLCACLTLTAASAEIGAIAVLLLGGAQLGRIILGLVVPSLAPGERLWVWLVPSLVAACVVMFLVSGRLGAAHEVFSQAPSISNTWLSIGAARTHAARVFGGVWLPGEGRTVLWLGIPVKLALIAGFWALLPAQDRPPAARISPGSWRSRCWLRRWPPWSSPIGSSDSSAASGTTRSASCLSFWRRLRRPRACPPGPERVAGQAGSCWPQPSSACWRPDRRRSAPTSR